MGYQWMKKLCPRESVCVSKSGYPVKRDKRNPLTLFAEITIVRPRNCIWGQGTLTSQALSFIGDY